MSVATSIESVDRIAPRQCRRCLVIYPGLEARAAFRRKAGPDASGPRHHAVCIMCELTARTNERIRDRWRTKANDTIARHAKRFGISKRRLVIEFGWDSNLVAHDLEHAYFNSCPYCDNRYDEMPNGLADVTIDITNPDDPPYYRTNAKVCCATCNREKGLTPPHLFAAKLAAWERWRRAHTGWPEGSLFA